MGPLACYAPPGVQSPPARDAHIPQTMPAPLSAAVTMRDEPTEASHPYSVLSRAASATAVISPSRNRAAASVSPKLISR